MSSDAFQVVPFPRERLLVLDTLHLGRRKPMMHGFLELDVTRARRLLREKRERTGERLSFTAFVLACLGRAISAHPEVQPLRDWRGRIVLFEDVDATTMIEVEVDDRRFALAHVVRAVNRRSVRDIHDELRSVQSSGLASVPGGVRRGAGWLLMLPGFLRRLAFRLLLLSPHRARQRTGTVLVTSVGMFGGNATGWGMSAPGIHNLSLVIGGLGSRPSTSDERGTHREVLCVTICANHDLVDGAPVARFVRDFAEIVEDASVLDEVETGAARGEAQGNQ